MAITSVTELNERSLTVENLQKRAYPRAWRVMSNSRSENEQAVMNAVGVGIGTVDYGHLPIGRCVGVEARVQSGGYEWKVTATFSTEPDTMEEREKREQPNPALRKPKIKPRWHTYEKVVIKETDGDTITNSAGDYYASPITIREVLAHLEVELHVSQYPTWLDTLAGKRNAATLNIPAYISGQFVRPAESFPAKSLLFFPEDLSDPQEENGNIFWTAKFLLEVDRTNLHDAKVIDAGYRVKDGSELKHIYLSDGSQCTFPVPLNGSGAKLANPSPTNQTTRTHEVIPTADYSVIPFNR